LFQGRDTRAPYSSAMGPLLCALLDSNPIFLRAKFWPQYSAVDCIGASGILSVCQR